MFGAPAPDQSARCHAISTRDRGSRVFEHEVANDAEDVRLFADQDMTSLRESHHARNPARMLATVEDRGLRRTFAHEPLVWQIAGFERP
jgi:hypothetical protein